MKKNDVKPQAENHFIKEWNEIEFNLSIPAKITHSNKPFIYFYWPNADNYAKLERARKGGIGGVKDTRISIRKKAVAAVDALILMLSRGWNPFTNAYVNLGVHVNLHSASPISKCLNTWIEHREERRNSNMIGKIALKNNKIVVKHFMDWLDVKGFLNRKIETFNPIDIDNCLGFKMNELGWGKVTYNSYRCDLCTFFSFLCKYKVIQENPVKQSVKKNTRRDSSRFAIYEEEELQTVVRLMEGDPGYFGLYVASKLLYLYNIRPVEMTRLQVMDVDWNKRILTLPPQKTKNGSEAIFQLNEEIYGLLEKLVVNAPDENYIFGHRCKPSPEQIDEQYFTQKFRYFRIKYNISTKLKFYALKHSSNFYDLEDGASFYSIMEKNRHASLQVTNDYIRNRLLKKVVKPTLNNRF
ncbi:tyrosine-type recombinase/integrase [Pedobacter aquatilis]|uniref:tyrosine-type recombinase/integrase n=1 Tax=Pedobacter aquatilis TaxID=351343 RepID=UPI0025B41961|nr:tyrosine-type recombinase/integrase [Pedobacter aquatilis]MDN3588143.1 tyrosine-type recombinase/integrase [Pedobacter aquatilis]